MWLHVDEDRFTIVLTHEYVIANTYSRGLPVSSVHSRLQSSMAGGRPWTPSTVPGPHSTVYCSAVLDRRCGKAGSERSAIAEIGEPSGLIPLGSGFRSV